MEDLHRIVDNSVDGMLILDAEGSILFANPSAVEMFGRPAEHLIGSRLGLPAVPKGSVEVDIVSPGREPGIAEMRLGEAVWSGQPALVATLRDVTERHRAREELARERDFFSALMENLGALVLILDRDGRIERVNRTCLKAAGKELDEVAGRPLTDVFPSLAHCIEENEPPPFECETEWDGLTVAWRVTAFGTLMVCTGLDVSDLKRAQEVLEEKNAELEAARLEAEAGSRAKSEFLAMMSHELRTPMSAVLGMLDLLLDDGLSQQSREYAQLARHAAQELLGVLEDVLDISKVEARHLQLRPHPFNLRNALERLTKVLALEARRHGCELKLALPDALPHRVVTDRGRLRQVLLNLLGNAIKFTDRGSLGLTVELLEHDGATAVLRFTVWDTGDGIDPEDQERIFEPFVQADGSAARQHEGTGLGLAIAARLVDHLGGRLELESRRGHGSRFFFTLRLTVAAEDEAEEATVDTGAQPRTILLVEDNPINRKVAALLLRRAGHRVVEACNGSEGLEKLEGSGADLVLLDIQMPGMSGYDVVQDIRRRERDRGLDRLPVVALTAHCMVGERERCLEAGMDDYLTKPLDQGALEECLERLSRRT